MLRQIKYFQAVVRNHSFSEAAYECNISQSATSQQIQELEREVANVAELLMSPAGAFVIGADFLIDGGATASYFYGALKPES